MRDADFTSTTNNGPADIPSAGPFVIIIDSIRRELDLCDPSQPPIQAGFGNPYQTRPSRSKNKVPYWKRVQKRRRRAKLAKLHKKKIKMALARKAKANVRDAGPANPTAKPRHS